ncbi:hypothetical protein [Paraburkholderia sp. J12]|uniref:hypothetical protein n=1 Tax=Paraburkholderia sp. J12 TaxID=2805432 RepID=UPI002ABD5702|nr:hypothetical protein [Paraburkholderia sp. J12]
MQMKESTIVGWLSESQVAEDVEFRLSGALSEWLFATHFWRDFNSSHGTMFDQFEEDEVGQNVLKEIAASINVRIDQLRSGHEQSIEFVYRRLRDGSPVTATVTRSDVIEELTKLHGFLLDVSRKCTVVSVNL